jgi:hypothetical protein
LSIASEMVCRSRNPRWRRWRRPSAGLLGIGRKTLTRQVQGLKIDTKE